MSGTNTHWSTVSVCLHYSVRSLLWLPFAKPAVLWRAGRNHNNPQYESEAKLFDGNDEMKNGFCTCRNYLHPKLVSSRKTFTLLQQLKMDFNSDTRCFQWALELHLILKAFDHCVNFSLLTQKVAQYQTFKKKKPVILVIWQPANVS